jgi:hypothetical protein
MVLVRPRLTDYHGIAISQEAADFAIPFLDEDVPLFLDPFLLWKSPSMQDSSLHTAMVASFNHFGYLARNGREREALDTLIAMSECPEVGLGTARDKKGHRIGEGTARDILSLFSTIPQVQSGGFEHIEEIQLLVGQVSRDRISDLGCNLIKSFLVDYTIDQCDKIGVPMSPVELTVFDYRSKVLISEGVSLPVNPHTGTPILLVPKRWLRFVPWINYDDYYAGAHIAYESDSPGKTIGDRIAVLGYNRQNYGLVRAFVQEKERTQADCNNDPLFKPIPVLSARRKLAEIQKLPTGTTDKADKRYEDLVGQLMASLMYPYLDFADEQSRTDSGVLIRDLIFYNGRSMDFLTDIYNDYGSRQLVIELKNVAQVEREHINQLNRYLNEQFGRFGVIVTRSPLPKSMFRNTIDLWAGQRRCIITLSDVDLEQMVTVFESKQRLPIEVLKWKYVEFSRACPS